MGFLAAVRRAFYISESASADVGEQLGASGLDVTPEVLQSAYHQVALQSSHPAGGSLATFDEVVHGPAAQIKIDQAARYTSRLGVALPAAPSAAPGAFFLNGAYFVMDDVRSSPFKPQRIHADTFDARRTSRRTYSGRSRSTASSSSSRSTKTS